MKWKMLVALLAAAVISVGGCSIELWDPGCAFQMEVGSFRHHGHRHHGYQHGGHWAHDCQH